MLNNQIIRQASIELEATDSFRVVKVASILSRLRAWYDSLFDPAYRERVATLKSNSAQFKQDMAELAKYINEVDEAIKNGDVDRYNVALEHLKMSTQSLANGLSILNESANQATPPPDTQASEDDLTESKPKVVFKESTLNHPYTKSYLTKAFKNAGLEDEVIENIFKDPQFLRDIERAVENGDMVHSEAVPASGKNEKRVGEMRLTYETKPFNLTNFPIALQLRVLLVDMSKREHNRIPQMTVMRLEDIRIKKLTTANFSTFMEKTAILDEKYKEYEGSAFEWAFDLSKIEVMRHKYNWGNHVGAARTPISRNQFVAAAKNIWPDIFPDIPMTEAGIGVLWAQAALETGHFKHMYNYNFGNVKATPGWSQSHKWTNFACFETIKGKSQKFTSQHPICFWRAFDTLEEGMKNYLAVLGSKNYRDALVKATQGDPKGFIYGLKAGGYFTAGAEGYANSVAKMYSSYRNNIMEENKPEDDRLAQAPAGIQSEVIELMNYFNRAASPLTNIVKQSIADLILPRSEFSIQIKSSSKDRPAMMEYASILSNALQSAIDADTDIHSDGNTIELACSVAGGMDSTTKAAKAISEIVSKAFVNKYRKLVYGSVKTTICKTAMLSEFEVERQRRKFFLRSKV